MPRKPTEPLLKSMANSRPRGKPKFKMSSKSLTDQITIHNRVWSGNLTTDASGNTDGTIKIQPAFAGNGPMTNVSQCYQEYKGLNLSVTWQSNIGYNNSGIIWIGYIDNPEMMANWTSYGSNRYAIIKSLPNAVSGHLFDNVTCTARVPLRRKWFSLDSSATITAAECDRSQQGWFVYVILGGPASTNVGSFMSDETHTLKGLINPLATTTLTTRNECVPDKWSDCPGEPKPPAPKPPPAPAPKPDPTSYPLAC